MNKKDAVAIIEELKNMYPDAKCSLDFKTPFQMLVAVVLSAQCTDERVNKTTPSIFEKYPEPIDFVNMDIAELENLIHPCGFYKTKAKNLKKTAEILVQKYNSIVPQNMEELMKIQVEAIKNIKIDKVTVWDGGSNGENGKTATADFISGIMKAIPPMGEMFNQAGMELPKFLGEKIDDPKTLDS